MLLEIDPGMPVTARVDLTLHASVRDSAGTVVSVEPYLGMPGHGVVARLDGQVYVHLHPMGTVTMAAQQAFEARDRGDTTQAGRLNPDAHATHVASDTATRPGVIDFPYAFPTSGEYRVFVQVRRSGRILTGSFPVSVVDGRGIDKAK